jgi:hypothetical protein
MQRCQEETSVTLGTLIAELDRRAIASLGMERLAVLVLTFQLK